MLIKNLRCSKHPDARVYSTTHMHPIVCEICHPEKSKAIRESGVNYLFIGDIPPPHKATALLKPSLRTLFLDDGVNAYVVKFYIGMDTEYYIPSVESLYVGRPLPIRAFPPSTRKYIWNALNTHCKEI